MKTKVDRTDGLPRRAKAKSAIPVQKFHALVAEGPARALEAPAGECSKAKLSASMKRARGVMDSPVSDLASNPNHLAGLGRNAGPR